MPGPYSYDNSIPNDNNDPAVDQPLMLQNFQSIQSYNQEDHIDFDQATAGLHKRVRFPSTAYDPGASSVYPILFTKNVNAIPRLFFYSGTQAQSSDQYTAGVANETNGSTFLFGGIILKWAKVNVNSGTTSYTFAGLGLADFPSYCYAVTLSACTVSSGAGGIRAYDLTKTGCKIDSSDFITGVFIIAIGS